MNEVEVKKKGRRGNNQAKRTTITTHTPMNFALPQLSVV
jgi:hypothetical protein